MAEIASTRSIASIGTATRMAVPHPDGEALI
jgi:hypothetical protein